MDFFWSLLQRSTNQGYRSSAMGHFVWLILVLLSGLTSARLAGVPEWIVGTIAVLFAIAVLSMLAMGWYFAIKKPEYLRSEKYAIAVRAMEKRGWRGDDSIGFMRAVSGDEPPGKPGSPPSLPTTPFAGLPGPEATFPGDDASTGATPDQEGQ